MDLRQIGWGSAKWIQLAQDRGRWRAVVNMVMNLSVLAPLNYVLKVCGDGGVIMTNFWALFIVYP
jgi:hypothetical protein